MKTVAVIGCGRIADMAHFPALSKLENVRIKYACDLIEEKGKMLSIGVCNRYLRSVEKLREWQEEGKFGNVYHVYCSFRSYRSIPGLGGAFTTKSQSGGVVIDQAIHSIDLVNWIVDDKVKTVSCGIAL